MCSGPLGSLIYGVHNEGTVKVPYCYALLKGPRHNVMVDVGYRHRGRGKVMADRAGVKNWHAPQTMLREVGLDPIDIDTVVITHAHFDHFGNVEDFPGAMFYIQEREVSRWRWAMSLPSRLGWLMGATDPDDIVRGAELATHERLVLVDGDKEQILPGIDLFAAFDTQTFGSQFLRVHSADGPWILAGDLVNVQENLTGRDLDGTYIPIGYASGSQTNLLLTTERMMAMLSMITGVSSQFMSGAWSKDSPRAYRRGIIRH
jgi:glyoxylase-like metal-dependent hydrolase (beta-lactamase superfamily II)